MRKLFMGLLLTQSFANAAIQVDGVPVASKEKKQSTPLDITPSVAHLDGNAKSAELVANRTVQAINATTSSLPISAVPVAATWQLTAGRTIGKELGTWSKTAGWQVIWNLPKDWAVPATTTFTGDFKTVASQVISTLAANGALVRAQFFDGNKTMVVTGPGVTPK